MLISHSRKFVFIHIPKTGGSSIEKALVPYARWQERMCLDFWPSRKAIALINRAMGWTAAGYKQYTGIHKHARACVIRAAMPPGLFDQYFRFTVVRNPFDRLVSDFFYRLSSITSPPLIDPDGSDQQSLILRFRNFVRHTNTDVVPTMTRFVQDPATSQSLVNYVAHLETIDADFLNLQRQIAIHPFTLARANVSRKRPSLPLEAWYDSQTIEIICERYAADFHFFGYSTDLPQHPGLMSGIREFNI